MAASELLKLETVSREGTGKQAAKAVRRQGLTPGIIYGLDKDPKPVAVPEPVLAKMLTKAGGKTLIEVTIDGSEPEPVVVLEVQREPLTNLIRHIDLKRIDLTKLSEFIVRVEFVGEPIGAKDGGLVNEIEDSITVECLPINLPDEIVVDISKLGLGDGLHVSDLEAPEGVKIKTDPRIMLINIVAPEAEKEVAAPVEAEEGEEEGEAAAGKEEEEKD